MALCMVYNTTGEPLELVPVLRGLGLHLRGKAVILETVPGLVVRSVRVEFPAPASVVLRRHRRHRSGPAPLTNRSLFLRDGRRCAYCGSHESELRADRERLTRDHVVPRSRGGADEWANVVTACSGCNGRKGDRTPVEAGLALRVVPWAPGRRDLLARRDASRAETTEADAPAAPAAA